MNSTLPEIPRVKGIFVTGTDTDVGKSVIAAGLTAALRSQGIAATYFKPVQSGCQEENGRLIAGDARLAKTMAELEEPLDSINAGGPETAPGPGGGGGPGRRAD